MAVISQPQTSTVHSEADSRRSAPTQADVTTVSSVRPNRAIAPDSHHGHECFYTFAVSKPLPVVDLAATVAKRVSTPRIYVLLIGFMRERFHLLVLVYRLAVPGFAALLFITDRHLRTLLTLAIIPSSMAIISTALFVSTDLVVLLTRNYEFWFLVILNVLNWIVVGLILNDIRAVVCAISCFGFQSILLVDSNYRTYRTTMASAALSTPLVLAIAVIVAGEWVADGSYFKLHIGRRVIGNAADFISFSSSTLVLFIVKLVILKKTRAHHSIRGFATIPCVVIKATLRYAPLSGGASARLRRGIGEQPSKLESRGCRQPLILSNLPLNRFDVNRTLLPHRFWRNPPHWAKANNGRALRRLLYLVGCVAISLLVLATLRSFYELHLINSLSENDDASRLRYESSGIMLTSAVCTVLFCGAFVPFYQRDLLRLLLHNFDFVFSLVQTLAFVLCVCDLHRWRLDRCLIVFTWMVWFVWALTLDALTPPINNRIFHFRKRWSAPVLASLIAGGISTGMMAVLMPGIRLHDRVIWQYDFPRTGVSFTVRTQTVMIGRIVTIVLWCSRQVFLRITRSEDELILIRGDVEYISPYSTFPRQNAHGVAAIDETSGRSSRSEVIRSRIFPRPASFIQARRPRVGS